MEQLRRTPAAAGDAYPALKRQMIAEGILTAQPLYYFTLVSALIAALAIAFFGVALVESFLWRLCGATVISVLMTQLAYIAHDLGHRQVFASPASNDLGMLFLMAFLGISRAWWMTSHSAHHAFPNDPQRDPNARTPFAAFYDGPDASPLPTSVLRWQALYFLPLVSLEGLAMRVHSIQSQFRANFKFKRAEALLLVLHFTLYFGLVFSIMPWWQAIAFFLVNQFVMGLYIGVVFTQNHTGMAQFDEDSDAPFLVRQVLTTRNVRPGILTDFWFGGLNYQIEHHLFPGIPRNKLPRARAIIKPYLIENGISYAESGPFESLVEVMRHMDETGASLHRQKTLEAAAKA